MIGKLLGSRYEILEEIGKGGMSIVYKARCLLLNRIVAVKVLRDDLEGSSEFLRRFNIEAQSAASLSHPNIVSIYDVGSENGMHYIVMEYIEGITLKQYIDEHNMDWRKATDVALKIASALEEAHKKHIVHRDIKPQNIIVTNNGDIKVTDFGIARASSSSTVTVDKDVLGSVHYFSPEQARGGYVDEKSDLYSLGVVMYEMLTKKVPFDADTPVAIAMKQIEEQPVAPIDIVYNIPLSVSNIVLKAMSKDTRTRYQSATDLISDLNTALKDPSWIHIVEDTNEVTGETIKIPAIKKDVDYDMADVKKSGKPQKSKSDKKTIVAAIITAIIIIGALSVVAAKILYPDLGLFSLGQNDEVEVPDLLGKTIDEAEDELIDTNFTLKEKGEIESEYDEGLIAKQSPVGGRTVKGKREITVYISKGGVKIILDDYETSEYKKSKRELEDLGLVVETEYEKNDDVAKGYIISQSPSKGKSVKKGDTVTLYVSEGYSIENVIVPNLIGETESGAKRKLEQYNLVLGDNVTYADSTKEKGTVISQSIDGGVSVGIKTPINIVLSNGKAPEPVNPPDDETTDPNENKPTNGDGNDDNNTITTGSQTQTPITPNTQ